MARTLPPRDTTDPLWGALHPARERIEAERTQAREKNKRHPASPPPGRPAAPPSADAALARLLVLCRDVLTAHKRPAAGPHPGPLTVLLALVTADYARERGRRLTGEPGPVRALIEAAWTRFVTAADLGQVLHNMTRNVIDVWAEVPEAAWDAPLVTAARGLGARFEEALAPTRLGALRQRRNVYRGRAVAFVVRRDWTDAQAEEHVETRLRAGGVDTRAGLDRLVERTGRAGLDGAARGDPAACRAAGLRRLRALPDEELAAVAANYVAWDPIVRVFDPSAGGRSAPPEVADRLNGLLERLTREVGRQVPHAEGLDAADAVYQTMTDAIGQYTYETGLDAWVMTVAVRNALGTAAPPIPETAAAPPAEPDDAVRAAEERLRPWHVLVRSTFSPALWPRLDVLWEVVRDEAEGAARHSLRELAARMSERCAPTAEMAVAMLLRRYRQRWAVVSLVLDADRDDPPDDDTLLALVRQAFYPRAATLPAADAGNFRWVAALARLGRENGTPSWATFASLVLDSRLSVPDAERVAFPGGAPVPPRLAHMRAVYASPAPARVHQSLRKGSLWFWGAAAAQLHYAEAREPDRTADVLRARGDERVRLRDCLSTAPTTEDRR